MWLMRAGIEESRPFALGGGAGNGFQASGQLEGEVGYGLPLFGDRFTGTPNVGLGLSDGGARDCRIGWRLTSVLAGDPGFEVSLEATRREPANDEKPEHGVTANGSMPWSARTGHCAARTGPC